MVSEINVKLEVEKLINYGLLKRFIHPDDVCLVKNRLIDLLCLDGQYEGYEQSEDITDCDDIINNILQHCYEINLLGDGGVANRDFMTAQIISFIAPKPSEVAKKYKTAYALSPIEATDYLYSLAFDLYFIRRSRMQKKECWTHDENYGGLECVVRFTGAGPKRNAAVYKTNHPKCGYCYQSMGYLGGDYPHCNLRLVKQELNGVTWYFGYASSSYFNEQCLLASEKHEPHKLSIDTFYTMLDFIDKYPHYFLGTDSDLPMLGHTDHYHFMGGCEVFPVEYAETLVSFEHQDFEDITFHILNWPVSAIRLEGGNQKQVAKAANYILDFWRSYSDKATCITAATEEDGVTTYHNSISTVARKNSRGNVEIDIFLRNNRTSAQCPNGIFNTHEKHTNIKTDDIRLIDVMGMIALPYGFDKQMLHIMSHLMSGKPYETGGKVNLDEHEEWISNLQKKYGVIKGYNDARRIVQYEIGRKFADILENCGVFKLIAGLEDFKLFMFRAGFTETLRW